MAIKNYTTKIDATKTIGEIQEILAKHNATKIMINYENGEPTEIQFMLSINGIMQAFKLDANVNGVLAVFYKQNIKQDPEQAKRTAWRNVKDWIDAQMAFVESGGATMDQIFLPYLSDGQYTLYEHFQTGQLALGGGNCD